jgi:glutathione reductase (NADPH)
VPFHGRAKFVASDQLQVNGQVLKGKQFVIATGATPARLHFEGEDLLVSSDHFLEMEKLPATIAFVGGGYIAFEFAHIAARAGARVTILHRGKRPLERFEPELVDLLVERTRKLGIDVHLSSAVERIEKAGGKLRVHAGSVTVEADMVVHGAGRVPDLDDLQLETVGVEAGKQGVKVNEFLQSVSNPRVYAAGDAAASGAPLTPVAGYHGRIVAANLLKGNREKADYRGLASVVFTLPPLASAGVTEHEAGEQNLKFKVNHQKTATWYSSRRVGEEFSAFKVLVEEGSGRILGAHLLGDRAEEVINVFALAIRAGLRADEVKGTLFAYPTHGSDIQYMLQ